MVGATFGGGWLLFAFLVVVVTFGAFLVGCVAWMVFLLCWWWWRPSFPCVLVVGCPCLLSLFGAPTKGGSGSSDSVTVGERSSMGQSFGDDWATGRLARQLRCAVSSRWCITGCSTCTCTLDHPHRNDCRLVEVKFVKLFTSQSWCVVIQGGSLALTSLAFWAPVFPAFIKHVVVLGLVVWRRRAQHRNMFMSVFGHLLMKSASRYKH